MCLHPEKAHKLVKENVNFPCMKKPPSSKNRHERTTYVKAIITNPKLSQSQILAEKFAKETLNSPRTLDTLKKLTDIRSINNEYIQHQQNDYKNSKKLSSDEEKLRRRRRRRKKNRRKHRRRHKPKKNHKKKHNRKISKHQQKKIREIGESAMKKILEEKNNIKKINKRSDSGCTLDKSQFLNSINHPLPMSEIIPDKIMSARFRRHVKHSSNLRLPKRQEDYNLNNKKYPEIDQNFSAYNYYDPTLQISPDDMILSDEDKPAETPQKPYSLNKEPGKYYSYEPYLSQEPKNQYPIYENTELLNNRAIQSFNNEVTLQESPIITYTTVKYDNQPIMTLSKIDTELSHQRRENTTAVETKQVANAILNEIIEELEELKMDKNNNNHKEGLPCKISGTWITSQAGVELNMKVTNHSLFVSIEKNHTLGNSVEQQIINSTWNITGHVAFKRGAPFSLIASNNHVKSLAAFVGVCKVCQGVDTIEGVWTVIHEPHTCRDFQVSTSIHNDIFRRSRVHDMDKTKHKNITLADSQKEEI